MKSSGKYDYLLEQYPDYMSKEQMFKACHISKKTCTFLLRKGLVKCSDNNQATCRYKIKTVNVIRYLEKREKNPEYYKPPANFYRRNLDQLPDTLTPKDIALMRQFYNELLKDEPDVLVTADIARITGYHPSTVNKWCRNKYLQSFDMYSYRCVPKEYLVNFLVSWHFIGISVKAKRHRKLNDQISKYIRSHRRKKTDSLI